ncbi:hypothetical protein Bhyg_13140 [Pseudolycoriella hygida]|uniref:Uncharacterized protein n=1 Tax=Pseudolycoriella hygida TaxID=35572 RepID=A0A9Q0N091_9DIPT|nr:hypothetical protein Bhyg_13140 [Pseudolycoriella hygida]
MMISSTTAYLDSTEKRLTPLRWHKSSSTKV